MSESSKSRSKQPEMDAHGSPAATEAQDDEKLTFWEFIRESEAPEKAQGATDEETSDANDEHKTGDDTAGSKMRSMQS